MTEPQPLSDLERAVTNDQAMESLIERLRKAQEELMKLRDGLAKDVATLSPNQLRKLIPHLFHTALAFTATSINAHVLLRKAYARERDYAGRLDAQIALIRIMTGWI
jgi:hypothetical protein